MVVTKRVKAIVICQWVIGYNGLIFASSRRMRLRPSNERDTMTFTIEVTDQGAAACREKLLPSLRNWKCNLILRRNPYPRTTMHFEFKCVAEQVKNKRHAGQNQSFDNVVNNICKTTAKIRHNG